MLREECALCWDPKTKKLYFDFGKGRQVSHDEAMQFWANDEARAGDPKDPLSQSKRKRKK